MTAPDSTVERLRLLLKEDFEGFLQEIDDVIARASPDSREFWIAMKRLAVKHRRGYPGYPQ